MNGMAFFNAQLLGSLTHIHLAEQLQGRRRAGVIVQL
jgi:hypothetical protein